MMRRPPRSPLFPSPTLSRSRRRVASTSSAGKNRQCPFSFSPRSDAKHAGESNRGKQSQSTQPSRRSEEHTSELQSQSNLVCRLLLEKKNAQETQIALLSWDV